ncbi:MAG: hypothetical protein ACREI8_01740, partial [Myxococcota bacterium]
QEVAYRAQLAEPRGRLHAAAARALLELRGKRGGDVTWARIAEHHEAAGEKLEAARAWARAAAASEHVNPLRAFAQWERALPLARESGNAKGAALALEVTLALAGLASFVGLGVEKAEQLFREGDELARARGDDRARALLLTRRGLFRFNDAGDWRSLLECADEASRLAAATGDHLLRVQMAVGAANAQFQASEFSRALSGFDEALALVEAKPDVAIPPATLEMLYRFRGRDLYELGRLVESRADLDRADRLGRECDSTQIGNFQSLLDARLGNFRAALDLARTQALAAERLGSPFRRIHAGPRWREGCA